MTKVKMLVQTTYKNELLREGKVYDIPDDTAKRWIISKIAQKYEEK
ncbi:MULTISPECIES: hypothetical protein [Gracilibacillus]|nr:hypothetical protein [Gracilibacillus dipsosauri]